MSRCHPNGLMTFSGLATGKSRPMGLLSYAVAPLPTDPIGQITVTFLGVKADSEVRIYYSNGGEAAGIESCAENPVLTWSVFSPGSPKNNVIIRIINFAYKIEEFNYTSAVGSTIIPIQHRPDPWAYNPS